MTNFGFKLNFLGNESELVPRAEPYYIVNSAEKWFNPILLS